jgi:copper oxidase (laccase) domain-containing protein
MLHRVTLMRTDVSEGLSASIIRVTRICEEGTTLATRCTIPEDSLLHSHRRENLKSYIILCTL